MFFRRQIMGHSLAFNFFPKINNPFIFPQCFRSGNVMLTDNFQGIAAPNVDETYMLSRSCNSEYVR